MRDHLNSLYMIFNSSNGKIGHHFQTIFCSILFLNFEAKKSIHVGQWGLHGEKSGTIFTYYVKPFIWKIQASGHKRNEREKVLDTSIWSHYRFWKRTISACSSILLMPWDSPSVTVYNNKPSWHLAQASTPGMDGSYIKKSHMGSISTSKWKKED